jgi:AcrR family transcriptional regulator
MAPARTVSATENGAARRDDILATATQLFAERGYANVGMRAIADEVGIRPASLYHHFASKEEILYAISQRVTVEYTVEATAMLESGGDPATLLRDFIVRQIVFAWENRSAIDVAKREMRELADEHLAEIVVNRTEYRRVLQGLIVLGVEAKRFTSTNPKMASLAILSMVNGVNDWFHEEAVQRPRSKKVLKIGEVADGYADLIVDHLLR